MAYVGTAKNLSSARETLASVLAGEAGNQGHAGMQAVGSVIQNRANQNFSGYGTSLTAQATARMQFQGQATPTATSYQVADQMLAGTLPDNTGGALYYANPGASTAAWARNLNSGNALQIGDHFFTNNTQGIPFWGNGVSAANATPDATMGATTANDSLGITSDGLPANNTTALTLQSPWSQLQFADVNGDGTVTQSELTAYNAQVAGASTPGISQASAEGNPSDVPTAIVTAGNQAAITQAMGLKAVAASTQAASQAENATNVGIWSNLQTWLGGRLLQVMVFVLALIFVLVGLYMFAPKNLVPPVPIV